MCEAIQQRSCHLCITEDLRPFTEVEVGRDDDAGAFKVRASEAGHSVQNMDANLDLCFLIFEVACL